MNDAIDQFSEHKAAIAGVQEMCSGETLDLFIGGDRRKLGFSKESNLFVGFCLEWLGNKDCHW